MTYLFYALIDYSIVTFPQYKMKFGMLVTTVADLANFV